MCWMLRLMQKKKLNCSTPAAVSQSTVPSTTPFDWIWSNALVRRMSTAFMSCEPTYVGTSYNPNNSRDNTGLLTLHQIFVGQWCNRFLLAQDSNTPKMWPDQNLILRPLAQRWTHLLLTQHEHLAWKWQLLWRCRAPHCVCCGTRYVNGLFTTRFLCPKVNKNSEWNVRKDCNMCMCNGED